MVFTTWFTKHAHARTQQTHRCTHMHAHTRTAHTHIYTHQHAHARTQQTYTYTHMHAHTHTAHTHTHIYTHLLQKFIQNGTLLPHILLLQGLSEVLQGDAGMVGPQVRVKTPLGYLHMLIYQTE